MKISIVTWENKERKAVRITDSAMSTLTVTKVADHTALIKLPYLDCAEAGKLAAAEATVMATALILAAKVARYLDDLEPAEAYDAIAGLPTTPYDGWRPMPRAGRTEN